MGNKGRMTGKNRIKKKQREFPNDFHQKKWIGFLFFIFFDIETFAAWLLVVKLVMLVFILLKEKCIN